MNHYPPLSLEEPRRSFPFFAEGPGSHYLDSAASAQKLGSVVARMSRFLVSEYANIHRGAYRLSAEATDSYEGARGAVGRFLGVSADRIVFTKGATEAINLLASALEHEISPGDVILLTVLEHHSNIVPWQLLAKRRGAVLRYVDCNDVGEMALESFHDAIGRYSPKIVSCTALANSTGTVLPVGGIVRAAREARALTIIDGCQAAPHGGVVISRDDPDFFLFSGHKLYGPTGIGALYVRPGVEERLEPYQGGGDMIETVTLEGSTFAPFPQRFEAGTPPIAEAIGLGVALDELGSLPEDKRVAHESELFRYGRSVLASIPQVSLLGPTQVGGEQRAVLPFTVRGVHPHDLATIADSWNVQIRAGHHCAMPAHKRLGVPSSARASIGLYTTKADFDALGNAVLDGIARLG